MTENKRFTVHIVFYNLEKTEGEIELKDNGQPLLISESIDDVRYLKDLLNELHEENQRLKKAEILANYRGEMVGFATALLDDLGSETMREMWREFREEKYREWRELE